MWKKPGSGLEEQHVSGTVKFGGGSLMAWGCMTPQGVGDMCKIDGRMDAELYTTILQDDFLKTVEFYGLDRRTSSSNRIMTLNTPQNLPQNGSRTTTSMF